LPCLYPFLLSQRSCKLISPFNHGGFASRLPLYLDCRTSATQTSGANSRDFLLFFFFFPSSSSAPGGIILGIWAKASASDSFLAFFGLSSPWEVETRGRLGTTCRVLRMGCSFAAPALDSNTKPLRSCWSLSLPPFLLPSQPPGTRSSPTSDNPYTQPWPYKWI